MKIVVLLLGFNCCSTHSTLLKDLIMSHFIEYPEYIPRLKNHQNNQINFTTTSTLPAHLVFSTSVPLIHYTTSKSSQLRRLHVTASTTKKFTTPPPYQHG